MCNGSTEQGAFQMDSQSGGRSPRFVVWLTAAGTLVAIATGMVTLGHEVFKDDEALASIPAYQAKVGQICDDLNDAEKERAGPNYRRLERGVRHGKTFGVKRDAVRESVRSSLADADHLLVHFKGLRVPKALAGRHTQTAAIWTDNNERLRDYMARLDAVTSRRQLVAAADAFSHKRKTIARRAIDRDSGLYYLGDSDCDLNGAIPTEPVTLYGSKDLNAPAARGGKAARAHADQELRAHPIPKTDKPTPPIPTQTQTTDVDPPPPPPPPSPAAPPPPPPSPPPVAPDQPPPAPPSATD
jgi:hypothetical protein